MIFFISYLTYSVKATDLDGDSDIDEQDAELAGYVVTNPNFNVNLSSESLLGVDFGVLGGLYNTDHIYPIEVALTGNFSSFPYEHSEDNRSGPKTHNIVSFVTKYRHKADFDGVCGGGPASESTSVATNYSAPFQDTSIGEMEYEFRSFNNTELSQSTRSGWPDPPPQKFNNTINYHIPIYFTTSGWANYSWSPKSGCTYFGVPNITFSYKWLSSAEGNKERTELIKATSIKDR